MRIRYRDSGYAASTATMTVMMAQPAASTRLFMSGTKVVVGVRMSVKFWSENCLGNLIDSVALVSTDASTSHASGSAKATVTSTSTPLDTALRLFLLGEVIPMVSQPPA